MKTAILYGPRDLRLEDQPLETDNLGPYEIWVETQISAFKIGTDRGNYEGAEQVPGAPDYPRWVGDSNFGIVQAVGKAVTRVKPGDRIVSRRHHQSEYVMNESESLVKVPESVDPEDAVWAHLYALSAFCYHKAHFRPAEHVAVIGLGVLGLGAVAVGPLMGARVVAVGNSPIRLDMAKKMGAHHTVMYNDPDLKQKLDDITGGHGLDLVVLTANPWPAFRTAVEIVRDNGRVAIVSLLGRGEEALDFNPLSMDYFYIKGISLIAVCGTGGYLYPVAADGPQTLGDRYSGDRIAEHMIALMADGKLEPKRLVTHRLPYTNLVEAYEMAYQREKSMLGVIFNWKV
jgi:threonine dehydrogenase-like Zn-dependent dehydrogenase